MQTLILPIYIKNIWLNYTSRLKQELLLLSTAMYPPRLHPGQQSAGPFDSHNSLNIGGLLRCVASTVHMDRMASKENKLSSGLKYKIDHLYS